MSQEGKKPRVKATVESWGYLRDTPTQPEGPQKPWGEELDQAAEEFVDFLQNSDSKKAVKDFIIESYKKFESEKVARVKERIESEQKVNRRGATGEYQPGNIGPIMDSDFNMTEVEQAVVHSLRGTKNSLMRSVDDRVESINRLLADIGGFSAQLKSSFARSTVVFLEQEDPKYTFRECLIFSINLPNYELKRSWDRKRSTKKSERNPDGRTSLQATWDEAVNVLARIVETTGLKPKYCKNDRRYGRFVMKQDLRSRVNMPDEYFSFMLDYNTDEKIAEMRTVYDKILDGYDQKIARLAAKIKGFPENSKSPKFHQLKKKHLYIMQERDFFVGTTPDPNQLDEGLLFQIEVSTLKDYHIVKDRMQSIMTRYILFLSKIAARDALADKDLEYQLSKTEEAKTEEKAARVMKSNSAGDVEEFEQEDLDGIPQYTVDTSFLKTMNSQASDKTKMVREAGKNVTLSDPVVPSTPSVHIPSGTKESVSLKDGHGRVTKPSAKSPPQAPKKKKAA